MSKQKQKKHPDQVLTPWPVVQSHLAILTPEQEERALFVANTIRENDTSLHKVWPTNDNVAGGWAPGPTLYLEDHRVVDLVSESSAQTYEYRMLGLAGDNDIYLISGAPNLVFEAYLRDDIGLGSPLIINLETELKSLGKSLANACRTNDDAMRSLVAVARHNQGINIAAFQTTGDVWLLALELAKRSGESVRVIGPLPALSKRANDKLWFADLVRRLLGSDALPVTYRSYSIAAVTAQIRRLSRLSNRIVLKLPSSAGGLGNTTIESALVRNKSLKQIYALIVRRLTELGWRTGQALLVGIWDDHVTASPSVQIWIPSLNDGFPTIEGVFEQIVIGSAGAFVGARSARLPKDITGQLTTEALLLARTMQYLGYFGRLSLDTVLIEKPDVKPAIHWIEANARWGGVSIPMTLGNKITDGAKHCPILIIQRLSEQMPGNTMPASIAKIGIKPVSIHKDHREGYVQLLPPEGKLQLLSIYGATEPQMEKILDLVSE
jgi:hypothetical protein